MWSDGQGHCTRCQYFRQGEERGRRFNATAGDAVAVNAGIALTRTHFNLSLRGAQRRGNLVEVEHTSANHHCYADEIATLCSQ